MNERWNNADEELDAALAAYVEAPDDAGLERRVRGHVLERTAKRRRVWRFTFAAGLATVAGWLLWVDVPRVAVNATPKPRTVVTEKHPLPIRSAPVVASATKRPIARKHGVEVKLARFPSEVAIGSQERALLRLARFREEEVVREVTTLVAENVAKKFYELSFVVKELENERVINTRSYYGMTPGGKGRVIIRAGERVPFASHGGTTPEYQQIDVGVRIDCNDLVEDGGQVSLEFKAEISSVLENRGDNPPPPSLPVIRNNQWEAMVRVPLKQPTVIFSSDDPASKHKMQLQLTVTPVGPAKPVAR